MLQSTTNTTENGKEGCKLSSDNPNHDIYSQNISRTMNGAVEDMIRSYLRKTLEITSNTRGNKEEKLIVHHAHILSIYKDKTNNLFDIVTLRHCLNMVIIYVPQ